MTKLGAVPINSELPYLEFSTWYPVSNQIAAANFLDMTLGTFTMPWPGSLLLQIVLQAHYTGLGHFALDAAPTTSPAVTTAVRFDALANSSTVRNLCTCQLSWSGLANSQVVTPVLKIMVGGAPTTLTLVSIQLVYQGFRA